MSKLPSNDRVPSLFPVFDDDTGVKLASSNERVLFEDDFAGASSQKIDATASNEEQTYAEKYFQEEQIKNQIPQTQSEEGGSFSQTIPAGYKTESIQVRERKAAEKKQGLLHGKVYRHTYNRALENSYREAQAANERSGQKNFSTSNRKNTASVVKRSGGAAVQNAQSTSLKSTPSGNYELSSRFRPKQIPNAYVPKNKSYNFTKSELASSLAKPKRSYMLFNMEKEEESSFFEKQSESDPTVQKFDRGLKSNKPAVTRRQFQEMKNSQLERFDAPAYDPDVQKMPQSRKEWREAKSRRANQTPFVKKQKMLENEEPIARKKNARLEKSLSGIMDEENANYDSSHFFED